MEAVKTDPEALLAQIRQEVARRKQELSQFVQQDQSEPANRPAAAPASRSSSPVDLGQFDYQARGDVPLSPHIRDLLAYHDRRFLEVAYQAILGRSLDAGAEGYLQRLRGGENKIAILAGMRFSREGRARGVRIRGLLPRVAYYVAGEIPVFGYVVRWVGQVVSLPREKFYQRQWQHYMLCLQTQQQDQLNHLLARIEEEFRDCVRSGQVDAVRGQLAGKADGAALGEVRQQLAGKADGTALDEVRQQLAGKADGADFQVLHDHLQIKADASEVSDLRQKIEADAIQVAGKASASSLEALRAEVMARADRMMLETLQFEVQMLKDRQTLLALQTVLDAKQDRERPDGEAVGVAEQIEQLLARIRQAGPDSREQAEFYLSFEDHFRGSREEIIEKQKVYLPFVREARAGTADRPVLDVGCGRGEWLELLGAQGLVARGVDINEAMLRQCRQRNLSVQCADVLAYLGDVPAGSLGAVTAFQVVEHLPYEGLLMLLRRARRALAPGGLLVLETPNPENVEVAMLRFYVDPSHVRPIPPASLLFCAQYHGFAGKVIYLNAASAEQSEPHQCSDYAVVARVPQDGPTS